MRLQKMDIYWTFIGHFWDFFGIFFLKKSGNWTVLLNSRKKFEKVGDEKQQHNFLKTREMQRPY